MSNPFDSIPRFSCTIATNGTITSLGHGLSPGTRIQFYNVGGALPPEISTNTTYYVRSTAKTSTFNISSTEGGAAMTFANTGTGTHYWAALSYFPITSIDIGTNILTSTNSNMSNGTRVWIYGAVIPDGLSENTTYFVVNSSGDSFQLSLTAGGSAVDITTTGTNVYWAYVNRVPVTINTTTDGASVTGGTSGVAYPLPGDPIRFTYTTPPTPITDNVVYYARYYTTPAFYVSSTPDGSTINITAAGTNVFVEWVQDKPLVQLDVSFVNTDIEQFAVSYKEPPDASKLQSGYVYDTVTGTLESGGGEFSSIF